MTNSRSSAEPPVDIPSDSTVMPPKASVKPRRTGTRRVFAPAGSPATSAATPSALLILGADGMIVTEASPTDTDDVDTPGAAESTTPHEPQVQNEAEPEAASDSEALIAPGHESDSEPKAPAGAVLADEVASGPATEAVVAAESDAVVLPETDVETGDSVADAQPPSIVAPDTELEPASEADVSVDPVAQEPAPEAVPASRRERRLAEQKVLERVVPVQAPEPARQTANARAEAPKRRPADQAGKLPGKRNKSWSILRGCLLFAAIAAVVIGMGTVVTGQGAPTDGPSVTDITRQQAWAESKALLETAQELTDSATIPSNRNLLESTAAALKIQIAALADGLPAPSSVPTPTSSAGAATTPGFVTSLAANANVLLAGAVAAEGSMGRVFAATGTSQLLHATAISQANGLAAPASPFLPTAADAETPPSQVCNTMLTPQPGVSSDAALIAATEGEQKAVFAYQVATTRLAEPDFSKSMELLAGHQQRLVLLNRELVLRCLPQIIPVPGFVLDAAFTAAPKKALAELEGQLTVLYGDVSALSKPHRDVAPETAGAAPKESTANISQLRELSVGWLLGSALKQQFWGGAVGALPGIAETDPAASTAGAAAANSTP